MMRPLAVDTSHASARPVPDVLRRLTEAVVLLDVAYLADRDGRLIAASRGYRELMEIGDHEDRVPPRHAVIVMAAAERGETLGGTETLGRGLAASAHIARHSPVRLPDGEVVGVLGVLIDAKEDPAGARASKDRRRLQDFIRASADWVWETDRNGAISFVSDRVIEALGLPPVLLLGRPLHELGRPAEAGSATNTPAAAMAARRPFRGAEIIMDDREGGERRFLLNAVAAFDDRGDFLGFRGTATDITAQRRAEALAGEAQRELGSAHAALASKNRELGEALGRAHASERAKREFLATMSHELRTPLNAVIGFADLLSHAEGAMAAAKSQAYAVDIAVAARHLLSLIDDLLDVAATEGAAVRLQPVPTEVAASVAAARAIVLPQAEAGGVAIESETVPPALAALVDPTRIVQVLINLLSHAVAVTPANGRVSLRATAATDITVIEVSDGGPALTREAADRLFESFSGLGSSLLARPGQGLGLGLPIARGLARLMGGDIALAATGAGGSTIRLTLPRAGLPVAKR